MYTNSTLDYVTKRIESINATLKAKVAVVNEYNEILSKKEKLEEDIRKLDDRIIALVAIANFIDNSKLNAELDDLNAIKKAQEETADYETCEEASESDKA